MFRSWINKSWPRSLLITAWFLAGCGAGATAADTIAGVVRNLTRKQFAAGDDVILLHSGQSMHEEARTRTDLHGAFSLSVPCSDKLHVVRVVHQDVDYDQQASASAAIAINVFDRAAKVPGVTGSIEIIRIATKGDLVHVSDMVELRNNSNPPLTQAGESTFEVYLPAHARIDSILASSSEKIPVKISARLLPGVPGHYAVNLPLRPGATQFAFNYDLPYNGHALFHMKGEYPVEQLAVMIPPTMKFSSNSGAFQVLPTGNSDFRAMAAVHVKEGDRPGFEISGGGTMPAPRAQAPPKVPMAAASPPAPSEARVARAFLPATRNSATHAQGVKDLPVVPAPRVLPFSHWRWWALAATLVLALAGCGLFLSRRHRPARDSATAFLQKPESFRPTSSPLIETLKNELLQLEMERVRGTVSREEYDSAKQALEGTVQRAMARVAARS